ncbi:MAG: radical SAM protein [Anaerolineales bacterium]|nr:radical SAM protein [Anaerolineales bacterium]
MVTTTQLEAFNSFFHPLTSRLEVEAIRAQWQALGEHYDVERWSLPLPVWKQRSFDDSPTQAWNNLCHELATADLDHPLCIYLHVPFCSSKCGFCDSYSFRLASHSDEHCEKYTNRLSAEMALWSEQGCLSQRPVSSVHFGGGTPAFLGAERLSRLIDSCHARFAVDAETEWALETTVKSLRDGMLVALHQMGFRRLHLGVQSLEPSVRKIIGRRCPPHEALEIITAARSLGWVVSVDLICGLPGQTPEGFIKGIRALLDAGVDGISMYELLIFPQNRRWAQRYGLLDRSHIPNYWMFLAGAQLLEHAGMGKNLFNHWAGKRDENIYFTFPLRGEACLALGSIGDGVFGDYHYRHYGYAEYLQATDRGLPGLEGGLRRSAFENLLHPIITLLLSGKMPAAVVIPLNNKCKALFSRWIECALMQQDGNGGLTMTASGAWFAGDMVRELMDWLS